MMHQITSQTSFHDENSSKGTEYCYDDGCTAAGAVNLVMAQYNHHE